MKKIISTSDAPAALGPYSQAVRVGSTIYCAGQVPLDPKSGQIVAGGIDVQTKRVMDNITAVLKAEGLTCDNVVKTTIFLADLGDFQTMNQVAALPKGARVEIEAIAVAGNGSSSTDVAADTSG
ncbi:MAG: reactive intermediate/imine deaminase [Verrucomicrobia bacterium]|nr:MAG: reactive intermediate/imine deaminase [Verrucomicrobiota bacterium]